MNSATARLYGELNDFVSEDRKQAAFSLPFFGNPAVKDFLESIGVPHTEIDLILINGIPVDFSRQVEDGDWISVYPLFESFDVSSLLRVGPQPPNNPSFVLDTHLGKLASYLRMIGFDTLYRNDYSDETLADISTRQNRILLTKDKGLLKRSIVTYGYYIRGTEPTAQVYEVLQRFKLIDRIRPFKRCMYCNGVLEKASKEKVADRLPSRVRENYTEFSICRKCKKIYWKGSHYERMKCFIDNLLETNFYSYSQISCLK